MKASRSGYFFWAMFLAGCSISQPSVKVDYYQLNYGPPSLQHPKSLDVVLGTRRFDIAAAYDHDRLVQREKNLKMTQSYYHRWINNPRMMLSDLLFRDLGKSGGYKAVVMLPSDVAADYEINGFVQEIVRDETKDKPMIILSLDITLLGHSARRGASRILFQKSYVAEVASPDSASAAVAQAASSAMKDISSRIQQDVYGAIAACLAPSPAPAPPA